MILEVAEGPLGRYIAHAAEFQQARVVAHPVEKAVGVALAEQVSEELEPEHLPGRVAGIAASPVRAVEFLGQVFGAG